MMNFKKRLNSIFLISFAAGILLLIPNLNTLASSIRVQSIGQTSLITEDEDNQINLSDFGLNSAWLLKDEPKNWLKFSGIGDFHQGSFHRIYDPEEATNFHALFKGLKSLGKNQIFRGMVDYGGSFRYDVNESADKEPFANHPYRLTDNTKGDINYAGPKISAQYCCNLFKDKLFIAGTTDYQLETGLKHGFIQPRTIYRSAGIGAALAYQQSKNITLGTTFNYTNSQEYIEYMPPATYESREIQIKKYRGEKIASPGSTDSEVFRKLKCYNLGFQAVYNSSGNFDIGLKINANFQDLKMTENRFAPVEEGTWKLRGYELNLKGRNKIGRFPLYFGYSFDQIYYNDWAVHPDFDILFGDDDFSGNYWGLGIAFQPFCGRLYLAGEIHHAISLIKKRDYISQFVESGNIIDDVIKLGVEYLVFNHYFIRAGFILTENSSTDALLVFSEYEIKNHKYTYTGGLGLKFNLFEADFHFQYSEKSGVETVNYGKRKSVYMYIMLKFYK